MKKIISVALFFVLLFLFFGCVQPPAKFQCVDGTIVDNLSECPQMEGKAGEVAEEIASKKAAETAGEIPEEELNQLCETQAWPPSCEMVPDETGREICKKCKEKGLIESKEFPEQMPSQTIPSETEYCPVSDLEEFESCGQACLEFIGMDECKTYCAKHLEECRIEMPPATNAEPEYWKAFHGISFWKKEFIQEIREVAELNANIFIIFFTPDIDETASLNPYKFTSKKGFELTFEKAIATARENNLRVILDLEVSGPGLPALSEEQLNEFFEEYKEFVVEWAKFSEKHKLFGFVVNSELDGEFPISRTWCKESCRKRVADKHLQELLVLARENFSGKIGVGVMEPWWIEYDLAGYDFFSTNLPCGDGDIQLCLSFFQDVLNGANKLKEKSNAEFIVSEWDIFSEKDATPEGLQAVRGYEIVSEEEEAGFYERFFEQYGEQINGIEITYSDPLGIKTNQQAKQEVKEFFEKN